MTDKVTKQLVKKSGGSILQAPFALIDFFVLWIGVLIRHTFDPDCKLWYKIVAPILTMIIIGNLLCFADLCFGEIFWTALSMGLLTLGLPLEPKQEIRDGLNKNLQRIRGESDQSTPLSSPQPEIVDLPASDFTISEEKIESSK